MLRAVVQLIEMIPVPIIACAVISNLRHSLAEERSRSESQAKEIAALKDIVEKSRHDEKVMKSSKSSQQEDLKIADKLKTITSRCDNLLLLLANQEIERLAFKQHLQLLGEDHLHRALKAAHQSLEDMSVEALFM